MPKSKVDDFLNAMEALNKWEREQITGAKLEEEQIREELSNHEAFYSHDIDSTCAALPMYSRERIAKVYYKNLKKCSHV